MSSTQDEFMWHRRVTGRQPGAPRLRRRACVAPVPRPLPELLAITDRAETPLREALWAALGYLRLRPEDRQRDDEAILREFLRHRLEEAPP